jgi:hypothetical protein
LEKREKINLLRKLVKASADFLAVLLVLMTACCSCSKKVEPKTVKEVVKIEKKVEIVEAEDLYDDDMPCYELKNDGVAVEDIEPLMKNINQIVEYYKAHPEMQDMGDDPYIVEDEDGVMPFSSPTLV